MSHPHGIPGFSTHRDGSLLEARALAPVRVLPPMLTPIYHPTANACKHPPPTLLLAPSKHPTSRHNLGYMAGPGKTCPDQGREGLTGPRQPSRPRRLAPFPSPKISQARLLAANGTGVRLPEFAGGL